MELMRPTKEQAIKYIKDIRNGIFERNVPAINKGRIAEKFWNDDTFSYGMEYGAILATMQLFDLTEDDIL